MVDSGGDFAVMMIPNSADFDANQSRTIDIQIFMALAANRLQKRIKKLRKLVKRAGKDVSADQVHKLRTGTRQMEATLHFLEESCRKNERRLLKALKPVRQKAGKVRDLDVFIELAARPQPLSDTKCSIQVLEHLQSKRKKKARKLKKLARRDATKIRKRLRRSLRFLRKSLQSANGNSGTRRWSTQAAALALQLELELRDWPALNRKNLHPFRLKVKELRYLLQLAPDGNSEFVGALGKVKDAIGQWHDWEELSAIAEKTTQHAKCPLLKGIHQAAAHEFERALDMANRMRKEFLELSRRKGRSARSRASTPFPEPALRSALPLAA